MNLIKKLCLFISMLLVSSSSVFAVEMPEALDSVAEYFIKTAIRIKSGQELHILKVVNSSNQSYDRVGKKIETELYFALERQVPDFKLFLGKGPNPDREIYLSGSYEIKGNKTLVKFRVFKGNEILAQKATEFNSKSHRNTLVAVLDIESKALNPVQIKAYSDIFRTELSNFNVFTIASSADVDKMNPDAIEKATGCTRDECATIIGEQLGVDRVISVSLFKLSEGEYVISAKIFDLKDGALLVSKTVEHSGPISKITASIKKLAGQLVGEKNRIQTVESQKKIVSSEGNSNLLWHIAALTLAAGSASQSLSAAAKYNDLAKKNKALKVSYDAATTSSERATLEAEYNNNRTTMQSNQATIQTMDGITAAALLWESYLIFFGGDNDEQARYENNNQNRFQWAVVPQKSGSTLWMNYKF